MFTNVSYVVLRSVHWTFATGAKFFTFEAENDTMVETMVYNMVDKEKKEGETEYMRIFETHVQVNTVCTLDTGGEGIRAGFVLCHRS